MTKPIMTDERVTEVAEAFSPLVWKMLQPLKHIRGELTPSRIVKRIELGERAIKMLTELDERTDTCEDDYIDQAVRGMIDLDDFLKELNRS
jgi:hypothetical protein